MKQLGANEAALRNLIEAGITVGSISENLFCVEEAGIGSAPWAELRERGFDRCGVKRNGRLIGYVETPDDDSNPETLPIAVDHLVADTTPIWQVMHRLSESRWLFVLTASGPTEIVTAADLAKPPAQLLMFGVISLLEMAMLALIRHEYTADDWRSLIKTGRIEYAEKLLDERKKKGQDIDFADCLQWTDKATICMKTPDVVAAWGLPSKRSAERLFKNMQTLRDNLAHAQHPAQDGDWASAVNGLREADRLITASMELLASKA